MIKGVFFDLYGTLYIYKNMKKAWKNWFETFYDCFLSQGLKKPKEEFSAMLKDFFSKPEPNKTFNGASIFERRISRTAEKLGLVFNNFELKEIANKCVSSWQKFVLIDPEAHKVLSWLNKRVVLALISNFDHPSHIRNELSRLKLKRFFQIITISSDVGVKKPNPEIFSSALNKLELLPSEVIYVGDSEEDVIAAFNAGIKPILIFRNDWNEQERIIDYTPEMTHLNDTVFEKYKKKLKLISGLGELITLLESLNT